MYSALFNLELIILYCLQIASNGPMLPSPDPRASKLESNKNANEPESVKGKNKAKRQWDLLSKRN